MDVSELLHAFYREKAGFMLRQWQRHVPFGDLVASRWERAALLGFGEGTSIYDSSLVLGTVSVGKNTWIGPHTVLDGFHGELRIGDSCTISAGAQVYTHDSVRHCLTGGKQPFSVAKTSIGNNTYIAPNVVIARGVAIGSFCLIGTGAYVNSSFPDYSVAWGQPAKLVGSVVFSEDGSDYVVHYLDNSVE